MQGAGFRLGLSEATLNPTDHGHVNKKYMYRRTIFQTGDGGYPSRPSAFVVSTIFNSDHNRFAGHLSTSVPRSGIQPAHIVR